MTLARLLRLLFVLLVLGAAGFGAVLYWAAQPRTFPGAPVEITIAPHTPLRGIATALADSPLKTPWPLIEVLARLEGRTAKLQAGTYAFASGLSPDQILDKIERGDVIPIELVIPEGWTFRQMRAALAADPDLKPTLAHASDAEVMQAIGAPDQPPEGLFAPDTYKFARGTPDVDVLRRAYREQERRVAQIWETRAPDLPLQNPYQALILASLVEKETGRDDERPLVAAVFLNRLKRGMMLQTDPAVIYGLGAQYDGHLHRRDLLTDTAYNTYTRTGLPPTPIALPGRAALEAAVNPAKSDALYFVARGDGSSQFSEALDAHNKAVDRYVKGAARKGKQP